MTSRFPTTEEVVAIHHDLTARFGDANGHDRAVQQVVDQAEETDVDYGDLSEG